MNWIPIKELLPQRRDNYLVTVEVFDKRCPDCISYYVTKMHYNGAGIWTETQKSHFEKVVAWQYLPDPYKAGDVHA